MDSQINVNNNDTILMQTSVDPGEMIIGIWKSGGHASTYLSQSQLKELIEELSKFVEATHV